MTLPLLTPAQVKVLAAAAEGGTVAEIAQRMGQTRTYVAARLSEAYVRLDIRDFPAKDRRVTAIREARRAGLIPGETP